MTTLQISDTTRKNRPSPTNLKLFLKDHKITKENNGSVRFATEPKNPVVPEFSNGFIGAAFAAYSHHHHLVMRPDDVWLSIATTFGCYVNAHSEEMRTSFVDHANKKKLAVVVNDENWHNIVYEFEKLLPEHVKDWIVPNFSTTTQKDRMVGGAVLMGSMKNYYSYQVHIMCGLPAVTLQGTLADWEEVYRRVERLDQWYSTTSTEGAGTHPIKEWRDRLLPVIRKIVDAYQGVVDKEFWNQICNYVSGGSGPSFISGWINLFVYFSDGKKVVREKGPWDMHETGPFPYGFIETGDIPTGCVEVPVEVNDNGYEFSVVLYAGAMVSSYDKTTNKISPSYDFAVIEKDTVPTSERNEPDPSSKEKWWEEV